MSFRNAWLELIGRHNYDALEHALFRIENEAQELRTQLGFARDAIATLKEQLRYGGEAARKAHSDALGEAVIADMKANPKKYLP